MACETREMRDETNTTRHESTNDNQLATDGEPKVPVTGLEVFR